MYQWEISFVRTNPIDPINKTRRLVRGTLVVEASCMLQALDDAGPLLERMVRETGISVRVICAEMVNEDGDPA